MLTLLNSIVFVHIVCAVVWVGSASTLEILEWQTLHATKRERLAASLHRGHWFGTHVFTPVAIVTLLSGILAVALERIAFSQLWVVIALVAIVVTSALGGGVIGRKNAQLEKRLDDPSVHEDEIERELMSVRPVVYLDLAMLIFILFDMVIRPTTFDVGFFIVSGIFFVAVVVGIVIYSRRHGQHNEANFR